MSAKKTGGAWSIASVKKYEKKIHVASETILFTSNCKIMPPYASKLHLKKS
jgi:hypothetical protein